MQSTVNLQTPGLYTEPNPLTVPEGALIEASNVVIQRDNVIEPRRGFGLFGTTFGSIGDRLKQLFTYKGRLLRFWGTTMEFDAGHTNNAGVEQFDAFSGSFTEAQEGLRTKSVESNGNFYFTASDGIKKISASSADQFSTASGYITQAGGIKALDLTAKPIIQQGNITGFLPQDSTVAYRAVWGTIDANKNLILGVPSQRAEVYNSLSSLLITDFNNTLQQIQNTADQASPNESIIDDPDYVSSLALDSSSSPQQIQLNLIALAEKLDNNILLAKDTAGEPLTISAISIVNNTITPTANVATITFSSGDPTDYWTAGSVIYLTGFPKGENQVSINGLQTISSVTSTTAVFLTSATGNEKTFTDTNVNYTDNNINIADHGFQNKDPIQFTTTGSLPTGLTPSTTYYAGNVTANTFQVYTDSGLSSIVTMTGTSTGTHTVDYFMPVSSTQINSGEFRSIEQPGTPSVPATDQQVLDLQTYLSAIISKLQTFPSTGSPPILSAYSFSNYISPLNVTTSSNAILNITIPEDVNANYFLQLYRSPVTEATGTDVLSNLTASDELQQVYEAFPTSAELTAGFMTVVDTTTDQFLGADLYTNQTTGVGIANANETPPFALDINKFKNTVFYANTRTKYRMSLNLLGVSKMVTDYGLGTIPQLTIADGLTSNTYSFTLGVQQETQVITIPDSSDSLNGTYFLLNTPDGSQFYPWFLSKTTGGPYDPAVPNATGVKVVIDTNDSDTDVATKLCNTINTLLVDKFTATVSGNTVTITNADEGYTTDATDGTTGFAITTTVSGKGEKQSTLEVLLSNKVSPAQAVTETAESLVRVINRNTNESIYAFYLSQSSTVPGEMTLESRTLATPKYYLLANNDNTGSSFNPDLSPKIAITSISTGDGNNNIVTTATPHGLQTGDKVVMTSTDSTPSANGVWTITYLSTTTFRINTTITVAATQGEMIAASDAFGGDNEEKINRIYYSRLQQPEAVPLPNTIDVGDQDKAILRIFPVRDSLFVFKEDGLFRISGEVAPWTLQLFDTSCNMIAPDSLAITKNTIYIWSTQGVLAVSEAGVSNPPVSRPIDTSILQLTDQNYPNFSKATWAVGYDSDNAYIAFTVKSPEDTEATIAYRYNTLTSTWTTFDKSDTCGIVNSADDKLYLGSGVKNSIEQERKTFTRFDYADEVIDLSLLNGQYFGNTLKLSNVTDLSAGDVLVQNQTVTVYEYNALLRKLSNDFGLHSNNISTITTGSTPTITTSGYHFLSTGDYVNITNTQTTPNIDGLYQVTVLNATQFQITVSSPILTAGTVGLVKYDYYNTLKIAGGANLESAINRLTQRLILEPSLIYSTQNSSIISNSVALNTILTLTTPLNLGQAGTLRKIHISGVSGSTPSINGNHTATVIDSTHVSIPVHVTVSGTGGLLSTIDDYVTGTSSKSGTITDVSVADPTIITSANHGMVSNRYVHIETDASPDIDGNYLVTVIDANKFSVPAEVLIAGTTGSFLTNDGTFPDLKVNYNFIISTLNKDEGTAFKNYQLITDTTSQETIIESVNIFTKEVITNTALELVTGPFSVYKAFESTFTYAPVTFKDTLNLKQVSEATLMFENKAFTDATLSFQSDLMPHFEDVLFHGNGNGAFGTGTGPFGGNFFGGGANAAPFRTYIPRPAQRCRYIIPKFTHNVALEKYSINGLTLTGNIGQSSRAYR